MKRLILTPLCMLMMASCSHKTTTDVVAESKVVANSKVIASSREVATPGRILNSKPVSAVRSVIVYKMNGDYADFVPVSLDQNGNISSYPDPVDISENSRPVALGDGWYLDRRGVNASSAFTDYTYAQYHALEHAPSKETLLSHIVARNAIVAVWDCGKSERSIAELQQLVKDGFPGCKLLYSL